MLSFKNLRKQFIALCIFLALVCGVYAIYGFGLFRFNYIDNQLYPIQGLDVSHHQGSINWQKIPKDKYQFVYIKASEGGNFRDFMYFKNWEVSRKERFVTGAYHFFTLCKPGVEQANNFLQTISKTKNILPPAIDLEFVGNCSNRPPKRDFEKELGNFMADIERTLD